ncbi:MAG: hypothetical protein M0R51_13835 [Clostridia bacterium]|jgi:hypothetical protein|nr:hypothetical protein [Clostridia bacterium]
MTNFDVYKELIKSVYSCNICADEIRNAIENDTSLTDFDKNTLFDMLANKTFDKAFDDTFENCLDCDELVDEED